MGSFGGLTRPVGSDFICGKWCQNVRMYCVSGHLASFCCLDCLLGCEGKATHLVLGMFSSYYSLIKHCRYQRRAPQHLFNRIQKPAFSRAAQGGHKAKLLANALENMPLPSWSLNKLSFVLEQMREHSLQPMFKAGLCLLCSHCHRHAVLASPPGLWYSR